MIKVLHVLSALDGGGVENMLLSYYSYIDKNKICFDFIVHDLNNGILEEHFKNLGSKIYHVTSKKKSFLKNIHEINKILRDGNYDVIHCHQNYSNFPSLFLAFFNSVKIRISHAHVNFPEVNFKVKFKYFICRNLNRLFGNYFFSCSLDAGKTVHGNWWYPTGKNLLMKNAININKFYFDKNIRNLYRKNLNISDKFVLLQVGRLSDEKNHRFSIDVLKELLKYNSNIILLIAGKGDEENNLKEMIKTKNLSNYVKLLGLRRDIAQIMNASDILLLPSKFEGLGLTTIEAQSTGLLVLASDIVPKETKITNNIKYLPLEPSIWVEEIKNTNLKTRKNQTNKIIEAGYSVNNASGIYQSWILGVSKK